MRNGHPPFRPKLILVQKGAEAYPLYDELRERYPEAKFEAFKGDYRKIPRLQGIPLEGKIYAGPTSNGGTRIFLIIIWGQSRKGLSPQEITPPKRPAQGSRKPPRKIPGSGSSSL